MDESALHNMSAPPRSQITIAPNKEPTPQILFALAEIPPKGADYATRLAKWYNFESEEALKQADAQLHQSFAMTPIMTTMSSSENVLTSVPPLICIYVLSRTTGTLFMKRRTPDFSYERMSQKIRLPREGFQKYIQGEVLCRP